MPHNSIDSYRPEYGGSDGPPPPSREAQDTMYHFRGNQDRTASRPARAARPPRGFTFHTRVKISERPLLTSRRGSPERLTFKGENTHDKFRDLENLTDTDETDMELSESDIESDRPHKRLRNDAGDGPQSTPKWSNPDPYTALPPIDHTTRKKKDVVKLIRRARNESEKLNSADTTKAEGEDFISFEMDDDEWHDEGVAPPNAPTGPRLDRDDQGRQTLGKRKRAEDEKPRPRQKGERQPDTDGRIHGQWQIEETSARSPWLSKAPAAGYSPGMLLHKEVIDFYNYIRPRDFEDAVRANVVASLQASLNRLEPGELRAFGSYAAGLYLPTSDLDLVYFQRGYRPNPRFSAGLLQKLSRNHFNKYANFLTGQGIAGPGSVQVIFHAKVQIIKFIDSRSGLRVDLCFNNQSGIPAIETFHQWRNQYPVMPMLVSVIKHFLMVRNLNDVSTGGLGGFSTICLVTSLLQHMPPVGNFANVGQLLLEFFNLYGNLFNRNNVAIRLDPPGYIDKASYASHLLKDDKPNRLTIIDPNRSDNNISGGTHQIEVIARCFSQAYESLTSKLIEYAEYASDETGFLTVLLGNDFNAYEAQRDILYELHYGLKRVEPTETAGQSVPANEPSNTDQSSGIPPTAASNRRAQKITPMSGANTTSSLPSKIMPSANGAGGVVQTSSSVDGDLDVVGESSKAEKRSIRLKKLRPDIADRVPNKVSPKEAARIGGYQNAAHMAADLESRLKSANSREGQNKRKKRKERLPSSAV